MKYEKIEIEKNTLIKVRPEIADVIQEEVDSLMCSIAILGHEMYFYFQPAVIGDENAIYTCEIANDISRYTFLNFEISKTKILKKLSFRTMKNRQKIMDTVLNLSIADELDIRLFFNTLKSSYLR